jgi:hypothetical protein
MRLVDGIRKVVAELLDDLFDLVVVLTGDEISDHALEA